MIYSASRRTDLPAFYPDFISEKVRRSRRLEAIVFWTKDIRNLIRHPDLAAVAGNFPCLVQFTVTGLAGSAWEPGVAPLAEQLPELAELGRRLPRGAVIWRFDPILPWPGRGEDKTWFRRLLDRFRRLRDSLEETLGELDRAVVSFPDPYRQALARSGTAGLEWPFFAAGEKRRIIEALIGLMPVKGGETGREPGIELCCEPELAGLDGTGPASCVDGSQLAVLYGLPLSGLAKDPGQRQTCNCVTSTDIGSYELSCGHGCRYCYARRPTHPDLPASSAASLSAPSSG
ncbi:MAG: DUF1848 domain-containing protein [Planctomycetota bacterium]|nr:DUF1848 domain-containing protein [Planctomycetota bacterium]